MCNLVTYVVLGRKSLETSVLYRSFVSGTVKKRAVNQNKNTNIIAYKNAGNCPYSRNFGAPKIAGPRLKPFQLKGKSAPVTTTERLFTILKLQVAKMIFLELLV